MSTADRRVTRRTLAWALGLTVALYALLWAAAGPPPGAGLHSAAAAIATGSTSGF